MTETFLNVTFIVPRSIFPCAVAGMTMAQLALPARTVPTARSVFSPTLTLHVATPLASAAFVSPRVTAMRTENALPAAGFAGIATAPTP